MHQLKNSHLTSFRMLAVVASTFFWASHSVSQTITTPANERLQAGIKLIQTSHYLEAAEELKRLTKENRTDALAWYYLGVAYVQLEDLKKATAAFETSVNIRPHWVSAHTGLANALLRRGKVVQAWKEAKEAFTIDPDSVEANYTLGVIEL